MKINEAIDLSEAYGANTTLGDLVKKIQGNKIYRCPKCGGSGTLYKSVNIAEYWECVPRYDTRKVGCDLCHGEGYTEHEYKPKMIQDGWE